MWLTKLTKLNRFYDQHADKNAPDFLNAGIDNLHYKYELSEEDLDRIPKEGPFILISNHPYGGLESAITLKLIINIRPDFKYLANFLLTRFKPLKEYFLPVNPFESQKDLKSSYSGIKSAFKHLKENGKFYANVNIKENEEGQWQGFPVVFRPIEFYQEMADVSNLNMRKLDTLKSLGHISNRDMGDQQIMLEFSKIYEGII